jgi:hypothetical protein
MLVGIGEEAITDFVVVSPVHPYVVAVGVIRFHAFDPAIGTRDHAIAGGISGVIRVNLKVSDAGIACGHGNWNCGRRLRECAVKSGFNRKTGTADTGHLDDLATRQFAVRRPA